MNIMMFLLRVGAFMVLLALTLCSAKGAAFAVDTTLSSQFLIISTPNELKLNDRGQQVDVNNFELGANKAPVPANTSFLNSGGGPTLEGAVPNLPANAAPVFSGIGGHGNIAITDRYGEINLQDTGVYADIGIGILLAAPDESYNKSDNSFFNDPQMFPNTYDPFTQTGSNVNPGDADQNTRIDRSGKGHPSWNVGVTFEYNQTPLLEELADARAAINALTATATLDTSKSGGTMTGENGKKTTLTGGGTTISFAPDLNSKGGYDITITVPSGLSVIDIVTDGNDFKLDKANLVIDGPEDAIVIFRLPENSSGWGANMQISQANALVGNGGIGQNSVIFYTDQEQNDTHFDFNNTIIGGIAFWSLGDQGGTININNAQGCTQLIADVVSLDDVRFNRCAFSPHVPDGGSTLLLAGLAFLGMAALHRKQRARPQTP